ncbi:MAG: hypothetical protein ACLFUI_04320 [Halanaerobiales bacterium]
MNSAGENSTEYNVKKGRGGLHIDDFIAGLFEVLYKALDSFIVLILLNIAIFKWIEYEQMYTYRYFSETASVLINLGKVFIAGSLQLLILKRILYQIEDKELSLKSLFSRSIVIRWLKTLFNLFFLNFIIYIFIHIVSTRMINNEIESFLEIIVWFSISSISIPFLMVINFVVIEHEINLFDSLFYTLELLEGYKKRLIIITVIFSILFGVFLYMCISSLGGYYITEADLESLESTVFYSSLVFSYFLLLFFIGTYNKISNYKNLKHKINN